MYFSWISIKVTPVIFLILKFWGFQQIENHVLSFVKEMSDCEIWQLSVISWKEIINYKSMNVNGYMCKVHAIMFASVLGLNLDECIQVDREIATKQNRV